MQRVKLAIYGMAVSGAASIVARAQDAAESAATQPTTPPAMESPLLSDNCQLDFSVGVGISFRW